MPKPNEQQVVTLDVVNALLKNQAEAYRSSFQSIIADVKEELRSIKKDLTDLKVSLQFTQNKFDESEKKVAAIEQKVKKQSENLFDLNDHADSSDEQLEYLENQSRRSNIRIVGVPEQAAESWDDTETKVKEVIKEKLGLSEEFEIDRCHRVGRNSNRQKRDGRQDDEPRPIVAKLVRWKDKERILKKAREVKPDGIKFLTDLSKRTLAKRQEKIPALIAARKDGKIAYFIMDRLIVKEKPPDSVRKRANNENDSDPDPEVSFNA
ncbi:MAG: hypothetical protein GY823_01945 [Flavobacteriaceae bacterium]|nr:hypothetical protein [Flavobacteriaceae bacterium]